VTVLRSSGDEPAENEAAQVIFDAVDDPDGTVTLDELLSIGAEDSPVPRPRAARDLRFLERIARVTGADWGWQPTLRLTFILTVLISVAGVLMWWVDELAQVICGTIALVMAQPVVQRIRRWRIA